MISAPDDGIVAWNRFGAGAPKPTPNQVGACRAKWLTLRAPGRHSGLLDRSALFVASANARAAPTSAEEGRHPRVAEAVFDLRAPRSAAKGRAGAGGVQEAAAARAAARPQ